MDYIIHPHAGIELPDGQQVQFGMTAEQIKALLGEPDRLQPKPDYSRHSGYDYISSRNLVVHFDSNSTKAECFILSSPAQAYLNRRPLLGLSYQEVVDHLSSIDSDVTQIVNQAYFKTLSIAPYEQDEETYFLHIFDEAYIADWDEREKMSELRVAEILRKSDAEIQAEIDELLQADDIPGM